VHEVPHIGNFRRFVVSDLIHRYFEYQGCRVRHITNIIDLDDRSIRGPNRPMSTSRLTRKRGRPRFLMGSED
jgi:cysteinyl-tRNA synthetase